jgi:tRNA-dihydrouridine synthase 3
VLIKPWLFREMTTGYEDITAEQRLAIYRRYVDLALAHWGEDEHGRTRAREFLRWHLGFWVRYARQRADGTWPGMQEREPDFAPRSPLEALLARSDDAALDYLADRLIARDGVDDPPAVGATATAPEVTEAG